MSLIHSNISHNQYLLLKSENILRVNIKTYHFLLSRASNLVQLNIAHFIANVCCKMLESVYIFKYLKFQMVWRMSNAFVSTYYFHGNLKAIHENFFTWIVGIYLINTLC